jgi:hypothetical protein
MGWAELVRDHIGDLLPGAVVEGITALGEDATPSGETAKGLGYGTPLRVRVREADGVRRELVLHVARADAYGHDRRSDRAASALLAFDTTSAVPGHVRPIDVGTVERGGRLRSLRSAGEFYLLTEYAPGSLYADDLRRLAATRELTDRDRVRCRLLADYLATLHTQTIDTPGAYTRAIRDLVGHGEGVFGIVDGYPHDAPGAPRARLRGLETRCADWRWRLRGCEGRLVRTHGDFHPFNLVFDERDELALLDGSRGCCGDAADDVTCLAVNYVFFALGSPGAWRRSFRWLWRMFWDRYLERTGDQEVLEVAPPFLAWRVLVLANPTWYPAVSGPHRAALLALAERALEVGRLELDMANEVFACEP